MLLYDTEWVTDSGDILSDSDLKVVDMGFLVSDSVIP